MKWNRKLFAFAVALLLLSTILPVTAAANSAAPPNLTILVYGAPDDLTLALEDIKNGEEVSYIQNNHRVWENCYRIYLTLWDLDVSGCVLVVTGGGQEFRCEIPKGAGYGYEDLVTLDFNARTLTLGQPAWRAPLYVALRVVLTLLIEGAVFFVIGYRKPASWIAFVVINLLTQTWLNVSIAAQAFYGGYWFLLFLMMETGILIAEGIAFPLVVKEKGKALAVLHAIFANLLSLFLGSWMLGSLPV